MLATISLFLLPKFRQKRNKKNQKFENEMFLKRFSLQKREIKKKKKWPDLYIWFPVCSHIYTYIRMVTNLAKSS
jgi:hypothetical protein